MYLSELSRGGEHGHTKYYKYVLQVRRLANAGASAPQDEVALVA
jgi:hypothetical protein